MVPLRAESCAEVGEKKLLALRSLWNSDYLLRDELQSQGAILYELPMLTGLRDE